MNSKLVADLAVHKAIQNLRWDIDKKVTDMRQRGVRIETSYGELDLDPADSQRVAELVGQLLAAKLALIKPAVPAVMVQDNGAGYANAATNQLLGSLVKGAAA